MIKRMLLILWCLRDAWICANMGNHCWYCRWLASRGRKMRRTSNLVTLWGLAFWRHSCITKSHLGYLRVDLPPCLTHFNVPLEFCMLLSEMICWADLSRLLFEKCTQNTRVKSETHKWFWNSAGAQSPDLPRSVRSSNMIPSGWPSAAGPGDTWTLTQFMTAPGWKARNRDWKRGIDCRCQKLGWNVGFTPKQLVNRCSALKDAKSRPWSEANACWSLEVAEVQSWTEWIAIVLGKKVRSQGFKFMWIDMVKQNSIWGCFLPPNCGSIGMIYFWSST